MLDPDGVAAWGEAGFLQMAIDQLDEILRCRINSKHPRYGYAQGLMSKLAVRLSALGASTPETDKTDMQLLSATSMA